MAILDLPRPGGIIYTLLITILTIIIGYIVWKIYLESYREQQSVASRP